MRHFEANIDFAMCRSFSYNDFHGLNYVDTHEYRHIIRKQRKHIDQVTRHTFPPVGTESK